MTNCKNCGGALAVGTIVCPYCKTRQDVDLTGIHRYTTEVPESDRICPRCDVPMPTIDIKLEGRFLIERCTSCMGMFFDLGELETVLSKSVDNVFHIDYQLLEALKNAKRHDDFPVTYIKCPDCRKLMNRLNFGAQSGVIIDKCRDHGIWLDGGELRQLMEWSKAGGQLHHQQNQEELKRLKEYDNKYRSEFDVTGSRIAGGPEMGPKTHDPSRGFAAAGGSFGPFTDNSNFNRDDEDVIAVLTRFVGRLFR